MTHKTMDMFFNKRVRKKLDLVLRLPIYGECLHGDVRGGGGGETHPFYHFGIFSSEIYTV